ncbi:cbb3-type cytochrome c oxidase subunit III [Pusillimonas sp. T7-7]|uniref:c-type cytochrome n=1 Tax=Pusillimonas sp. (strain T7-7) TaxID=1007105 RepID=UPI00020851A7|nr:cytochrome c [Pusillimonas sp. T7-7]AEC20684.1 cbb3-type cytochrome c oxidase subunit III [Pusillimonas sp. T7-7]
MSERSKKMEAQQREMPEPYEGNRPVPWLVIIIVSAVFIWAIGYIWTTHQTNPPSYGDRRTAQDFQVAASSSGGAIDGAQIYAAQCVACHQAGGQGLPGVFPPLAGSEWVTGKAALTVQIVLHGVAGELTVKGTQYNGMMPMFKDKLDDAQLAAVVSYIRSNFGNSAEPVDAATVAAERKATADHAEPWNGDAELSGMK